MVVILNYYKAEKVDRGKFFAKYDNTKLSYKLLQGAPLIVNVEGRYIKAFDIPDLIINRSQRVLSAVNKWLLELHNPPNVASKESLEFRWRR